MSHLQHLQPLPADTGVDPFHIPLSGLFADLDCGQGSLSLPDEFQQTPAALQLGVLDGWQRAIAVEKQRALVQLYRELTDNTTSDLPIPDKIDRFRSTCAALSIECPSNLAVLLQQY